MVQATTPPDPARSGRDTTASWSWRRLRLPATGVYLAALIIVSAVFSVLSDSAQTRMVLHASTNLHNLLSGRVGTLLASAFVIGDVTAAWVLIPLLACLLALAELRFGAVRLVRVFLAGHIGATLLVAAGLWIALKAGWAPVSLRRAEDVGISYGAMALVGALVAAVPRRWRGTWVGSWSGVGIVGVMLGQTFTNVGHLLAFLIGSVVGVVMIRTKAATARRFTRTESVLLAVSTILAGLLFMG